MLWQFAEGVRAESTGRWQRADFFFDESSNEFTRLDAMAGAWAEIARELGVPEAVFTNEPVRLRESLVAEYFIDTHAALFNGYCAANERAELPERAVRHLSRIQDWLKRSALSPAAKYALLRGPLEAMAEAFTKKGDWTAAEEVIDSLLTLAPREARYVEQMSDLYFTGTVTVLERNGDASNIVLKQLRWGTGGMTRLRKKYPDYPVIYEQLAILYHIHGAKLANAEEYDEALLNVRKAMVCRPEDESAGKSYARLLKMMEELQQQLDAAKQRIRNHSNLMLSESGRLLGEKVETGLRRARAYGQSAEAQSLAAAREQARLRGVWRSVGLDEPASDWNRLATELLAAMNTVAGTRPEGEAQLSEAWHGVSQGNSELAALDGAKVCRFLAGRLFEKPTQQEATPTAVPPAGEQGDAPLLKPWRAEPRGGGVPFSYWLTGPSDWLFKLGSVATAVFLGFVTVAHLRESARLGHRERAYAELSAAYERGDYRAAVVAAEEFFVARPQAVDHRERAVIEKAEESLVRWNARQVGAVTPADREMIARLAKLTGPTPSQAEK